MLSGLKLTNRAECGSRSSSKFLSNSPDYSSVREKQLFCYSRGHFVAKLTAICFSNVPLSESKVWQLARQKQIFTFHFARMKLILLEGRRLCFLIGLRFKEEMEKKGRKGTQNTKSLFT